MKTKIKNQKSRIKITEKGFTTFSLHERGFTLVELLSSIIVLVAVGSIIAGIITSSLRGTNKTTTIENIRQNGNYTLNQMSKNIEYAQVFNGLSNNDIDYVTSCPFSTAPTPAPTITPFNYIKVTPLNSNSITYNCISTPPTITANGVSLIDDNLVSLKNCTLSCVQTGSTDVPRIKIEFTLRPKNLNNLVENSTPPITFETSVTIRNYKK